MYYSKDYEVIGHCAICGGKIERYVGDDEVEPDRYYEINDDLVCEDCLQEYCDQHFLVEG